MSLELYDIAHVKYMYMYMEAHANLAINFLLDDPPIYLWIIEV